MSAVRNRIRRSGVAFVLMGLVLSTVDVNPAGEIPGALAQEPAAVTASPQPSPAASPSASALPSASASPSASAVPVAVASPSATAPAVASAGAAEAPAESVSVAAPKAPEGGDLTHLTFTATANDGLAASLVEPADDHVAASTAASIEVETVKGAGVELKVGDAVVPFSRIGKRTVDTKTGVTRYTYYGIALQPGPNAVALTALGANGLRGTTTMHRVFGPGRPANVAVSASGPLRADGKSAVQVRVEAHDAWGHRAAAGSIVQIVLVQGDAKLERVAKANANAEASPAPAAVSPVPLSTSSPGAVNATVSQQRLEVALDDEGAAVVRLVPGLTPGAVVLRAECGDVTGETRLFLEPNLRKPFVSGLVSAGAGAVPGIPGEADGDPNGAASRRGRIAMFGTGAMGKSLATFAYDSADTLQRTPQYGGALGSYSGDPSDKPYAITGDASIRRDDALSRDRLFARLDSGRTTAMWGEFRAVTGSATSPLGGFDQLVDGAKLDLGGQNRRMTLFAARNDVGYDRRVFAPTGLANGVALRSGIVVGSEVVLLATLDARTGAVIGQTALTRGIDYSIEYATGQLHFIDIPLPLDAAFNPQQIVVTYEYDAPGNSAKTLGGRAETAFGANHAIKLGIGYVNDTTGAGNVALATQDLGGTFRGGAWQIVHASSSGSLLATSPDAPLTANGGSALHGSFTRAAGPDRIALSYDRTDTGYNDPFGGLSTPGLLNERVTYAHKYAGGLGEMALDFGHQANSGIGILGSTQTTASLRTTRAVTKRFKLTAALERRIATSSAAGPSLAATTPATTLPVGFVPPPNSSLASYQPAANQSSTQASLGVDWRASGPLDVSVNRVQTLGGQNDVQPTQTDAQITYDLGKGGRAFLRERWSAAPVQSFAAATQSFTAATGGTRATELGFERPLGNATTLDTSYLVDHTASGGDVFATMGVREKLSFGRTKGDAFFQHATAAGSSAGSGGFELYGLTLSYADPANKFRASASTQLRTGNGAGASISLAATGAISPDLSLFAAINDATALGSRQSDERVGLAWRPSKSDAGVTLLQYQRTDGNAGLTDTQSGVLSLEQVLHVRSRTDVVGRYAYKIDGDSYYAAHSSLLGLRVDQRIGSRLDLGAEARRANVVGIDGASATAFAVEGGVRLGDVTRVGVGYNIKGTADPSLSATPSRRGFYVTLTSVVDRLFGWGKR
ncbi:MAG TPA: hypothetical protein VHS78_01430 [Candidatus Elarobacter sp.]|jgi:hypothetical protein|nr:hypothetical protein [Candidatus Elarobacter sp.]